MDYTEIFAKLNDIVGRFTDFIRQIVATIQQFVKGARSIGDAEHDED